MEVNLERPYYQDTGRRPFLFYAAIGARTEELHVSRTRHRIEEMPEGLGLSGLRRPGHDSYMDELLGGALGKLLDEQNHALYERARAAQSWLVVYGEVRKDDTLDYLRNAVGFVQAAAETGAEAILDVQTLELYSPEAWKEKVFSFRFHPYCHINAMISPEPAGTLWLHTRGMRKFGRPDISLEGVSQGAMDQAKAVVDQMISLSVQGAVFNGPVRLSLDPGETCAVRPRLTGDLEDPDYNNEHYSLRWEDCIFEAKQNKEDSIC